MISVDGAAVALGAVLGLGLWSMTAALPRVRARHLTERLAPYLSDVSEEARAMTERRVSDPVSVLGALLGPGLWHASRALERLLGGNRGVERWIAQAGLPLTVQRFRLQQVLCCLAGVAAGIVAAAVLVPYAPVPAVAVVLPLAGGAAGATARDAALRRRAAARVARLDEELPTVLEFLALTLSAGEGVLDALRRVARIGSGELAGEFRLVVADVDLGVPVQTALGDCSRRIGSSALTRTVDQLVAALERGAPVADVLRAQAEDSREETKRRLLEAAGRKEVSMLVPLVLLILPLSICFALLPGLFVLQAGF